MPRLFTALTIPPLSSLRRIANALQQADSRLRMEPSNRWHITLNFLGNVEETQIPHLIGFLRETTPQSEPLSVSLRGLGVFPDLQRPRVVWAGARGDVGLLALHQRLRQAVRSAGLLDAEEFRPHLTLARSSHPTTAGVLELLRSQAETQFGQVPVREVVLYESRLHPAGQPYHARARFPLKVTGNSNVEGA